ncbi:hypothetical protein GIB67_021491 [Kingdonia uniflora]|uniref:CRM domain-containing protein n=1 Tax=Kingdonia uniflora TaxID=39325 RepID=A0A7J7L9F5_9MAGN|nr:hypothetical protein GIB67_021491 [Kingdonia uniflora]
MAQEKRVMATGYGLINFCQLFLTRLIKEEQATPTTNASEGKNLHEEMEKNTHRGASNCKKNYYHNQKSFEGIQKDEDQEVVVFKYGSVTVTPEEINPKLFEHRYRFLVRKDVGSKKKSPKALVEYPLNAIQLGDFGHELVVVGEMVGRREKLGYLDSYPSGLFSGMRLMSTIRGRSMRSKVEQSMRRDVGKTQMEIRRARKLRKKLMTDEERLLWNLRRAKKKVALLLQRLKKYELPEFPPPRHDPELLTPEQLQAYKKIGFRNKNYVPVGVRGVFGGVVQNMHMHWKFHETVQVCCDNFPKEKIKEMATMLARLSGGIVVNVHGGKTLIMFRGRNYRQPKNLIPINTLTKRKALFKARFEQALESQKLNIKKIEQHLRQKGVNPEDPVAMASIQRVASTFFSAIDEKQGTPYVFNEDKYQVTERDERKVQDQFAEDPEQEQLDRFIANIEEAAEQEWEEEEAADREELQKIRYLNTGGRIRYPMLDDKNSEYPSRHRTRDIRREERVPATDEDEDQDQDDDENKYPNRQTTGDIHTQEWVSSTDEDEDDDE